MIVADGSPARSIASIAFSTLRNRNLPVAMGATGILTRRARGRRIAPCSRARARALQALALCVAAALAALLACRGQKPGRVFVLGLDGADPETIDLLMSEGKLPHFAKLRREGAYAPLLSQSRSCPP